MRMIRFCPTFGAMVMLRLAADYCAHLSKIPCLSGHVLPCPSVAIAPIFIVLLAG